MSRIRGRHTSPEVSIRKALSARGLRYRLHHRLPGRPDIVFVTPKVAVFIDGCFWHRCPAHAVRPKNNRAFWDQKLGANVRRDKKVNAELKGEGWKVLRFWEHAVERNVDSVASKIERVVAKRKGRHPR
jgi:DNA mismatch endonuclease (patch repair protein)